MNIEQIAKVCHETNRAYCEVIGDYSQKSWENAEQWQRDSAIKGVEYKINNPRVSPKDQHNAWWNDKIQNGWKYGPVKDANKKEHPCCVPYEDLSHEQKIKDYLFVAIVNTLK